MIRSYKYRIYPNAEQDNALTDMLGVFCDLYNAALQQRIEAFRRKGVTLNLARQSNELKAARAAVPELSLYSFTAEQQVLRRIDKAFSAFFRRIKRGDKAGFPRFRSRKRYDSADFRVSDGIVCREGKLRLVGIPGLIKVRWHRELPARPTQAILSRSNGKWYVTLQFKVAALIIPGEKEDRPDVGIDVGLNSLIALSNGNAVEAPRWSRKAEKKTRRLHRKLSRACNNSKRRAKARRNLARHHERVAARRGDFLHKLTRNLADKYGLIAMEDLNRSNLKRSRLARSIYDAAWTKLRDMLTYKAESAGGLVVLVNPRGTSQECSGCGSIPVTPKTLAVRTHRCPDCGLVLDRDVNAARNILLRALGPGTGLRTPSQRVAA